MFGFNGSSYPYASSVYTNNPCKVYDKDGKEVTDYRLEIESVVKGNEKYGWLEDAYQYGVKAGDRVDVEMSLMVRKQNEPTITSETGGYWDNYKSYTITVKGVEIIKKTVSGADLESYYITRTRRQRMALQKKRLRTGVGDNDYIGYYLLTDKGLNKLGDCSEDEYSLVYGEDFTGFQVIDMNYEGNTSSTGTDITENYEFDVEGTVNIHFCDTGYELGLDTSEIQEGRTADEFREIVKKHLYLMQNDARLELDPSKVEITRLVNVYGTRGEKYTGEGLSLSSNEIDPNDDKAIEAALVLREDADYNYINMEFSTEIKDKSGEPLSVYGWGNLKICKNSYCIHVEEFEEVAHATGASYERLAHDLMVNIYALKNETEKLRVGSLGDKETFKVRVNSIEGRLVSLSETKAILSAVKPGDVLDYEVDWFIPDEDRGWNGFKGTMYRYETEEEGRAPLRFTAYDSAKDVSNPDSEYHQTDGSDAPPLTEANPQYVFNEVTSSTLVGSVKVNIAKKFEGFTGYDSAAKHRYKVDNKKLAKVDKKGNVIPKKSGTIAVTMEQKNGKTWTTIGDPVKLYIQVPVMEKKKTAAAGETLQARSFISKTTYNPTKWESTKPAVADVDPVTGEITIKKKGTAKIIAVYGEGKNSSKKKYKTTLKVS